MDSISNGQPKADAPVSRFPLLVIGLAEVPAPHPSVIWQILDRTLPELRRLGDLAMGTIPMPDVLRLRSLSRGVGSLLAGRTRAVLLSGIDPGARGGQIAHWHHQTLEKALDAADPEGEGASGNPSLSTLRRRVVFERRDLSQLPFWLEDELPTGGLDFLGIDVTAPVQPGRLILPQNEQLRRLVTTAGTILWEIMKESTTGVENRPPWSGEENRADGKVPLRERREDDGTGRRIA